MAEPLDAAIETSAIYFRSASEQPEGSGEDVYLTRFPGGERKWQVSFKGGRFPRWNGQGNELFYIEGNVLMSVELTTAPSLVVGVPERLFTFENLNLGYDVSADGERFLVLEDVDPGAGSSIVVVQNWFAEIRGKITN